MATDLNMRQIPALNSGKSEEIQHFSIERCSRWKRFDFPAGHVYQRQLRRNYSATSSLSSCPRVFHVLLGTHEKNPVKIPAPQPTFQSLIKLMAFSRLLAVSQHFSAWSVAIFPGLPWTTKNNLIAINSGHCNTSVFGFGCLYQNLLCFYESYTVQCYYFVILLIFVFIYLLIGFWCLLPFHAFSVFI